MNPFGRKLTSSRDIAALNFCYLFFSCSGRQDSEHMMPRKAKSRVSAVDGALQRP
jgi:hypothetical protein